jgi:hypothetical protein
VVVKLEGKRLLERSSSGWSVLLIWILKELQCEDVGWIRTVSTGGTGTAMSLRMSYNAGKFLTGRVAVTVNYNTMTPFLGAVMNLEWFNSLPARERHSLLQKCSYSHGYNVKFPNLVYWCLFNNVSLVL